MIETKLKSSLYNITIQGSNEQALYTRINKEVIHQLTTNPKLKYSDKLIKKHTSFNLSNNCLFSNTFTFTTTDKIEERLANPPSTKIISNLLHRLGTSNHK